MTKRPLSIQLALLLHFSAPATAQDATSRAAATERAMTDAERTILTYGIMPVPFGPDPAPVPKEALPGAGFVAGIPRLKVPALAETDASLGVSYIAGLGKDKAGATALPSGMLQGSTWNPDLVRAGGVRHPSCRVWRRGNGSSRGRRRCHDREPACPAARTTCLFFNSNPLDAAKLATTS